MKKVIMIILMIVLSAMAMAVADVTFKMENRDRADLFLNGKKAGELRGGTLIKALKEGKYKVEVKEVLEDTSYYYYSDTIEVYDGDMTVIPIKMEKKYPADYTKKLLESISKNMVLVDGGTFQMGSNDGSSDEKPIHSVTLDSYYISKYEVTQAEYEVVMGNNPANFKGDKNPVEQVSWYDAVAYCNKLSEMAGLPKYYNISGTNVTISGGKGYRLPTEAEWEYASRGGNKSKGYKYSGSDNIDTVSWYDKNSGSKTQTVGTKSANELGIYDMSGNVWEWCWDWYDGKYYSKSPSSNPTGPSSGSYRVLRGGGWYYDAGYSRVANRYDFSPVYRNYLYGFRISRAF